MLGGDVRYAVLKGKGLLPALSVGVGYTYLRGGVTMEDAIAGQGVDITQVMDSGAPADTYVLSFTNPDVNFNWQAHVIEAKVQVSKNLFIITPYARPRRGLRDLQRRRRAAELHRLHHGRGP